MNAIAAPSPSTGLADALSPSQLNTYLDCSARWWYRYGLQLPDRRSAALGLGSAIHGAIAENYRQKIETREDLPADGMQAIFRLLWDAECSGYADTRTGHEYSAIEFAPGESAAEFRATGDALTRMYMDRVAPRVDPAAVELPVEGLIEGTHVRGFVDLVDVRGRVIDTKTTRKRQKEIPPNTRRQIATYAELLPRIDEGRVDTLTTSGRPSCTEQSFEISDADRAGVRTLYPAVQAAMRAGIYLPNRSSYVCGRRYCAYWRECEDDFGGQVKGGQE